MLKNFCKILKYSRMKKIRKGKLKNSPGSLSRKRNLEFDRDPQCSRIRRQFFTFPELRNPRNTMFRKIG